MSISAYTGLPGSGKTYSAVKHQLLPALKAGRHVVTNVPLRLDAIAALGLPGTVAEFPVETVAAEPHRIRELVPSGAVLLLDEVWRLFPGGQVAAKAPPEFTSFLAEHRHMVDAAGNSTQVVLVVQDLANIAAWARRLVEETFVTTKLGFVGLSGSYRVDVFRGGQTGATPPVSSRLRMAGPHRYDPAIFKLYKSHTLGQEGDELAGGANESKMDGRSNLLKSPAFLFGGVLAAVFIVGGIYLLRTTMHHMNGPPRSLPSTSAPEEPARSASGARAGIPAAGLASSVRVDAPDVRLVGEVSDSSRPGETAAYLSDGRGRLLLVSGSGCRLVNRHPQCEYKGHWYDAAGDVGAVAQAPVAQPSGERWSAPVRSPGAGVSASAVSSGASAAAAAVAASRRRSSS